MAKQTIGVGASGNDGTGDPLRSAFQKINSNTDELYDADAALTSAVNAKLASSAVDTDSTMAADSDSKVPSQKATKAALATKLNTSAVDADATFAANSDSKVPSQKAVKTAFDGVAGDWTSYTPTVTAESGTVTASSAVGAYKKIGKFVAFWQVLTVTTLGTGAGSIRGSLPSEAADQMPANGVYINSGKSLCAQVFSTYSFSTLYDGSFPFGDGSILSVSGFYQEA